MEIFVPFLLFLFAFNTSPTWATSHRLSHFKGIVCNQCQQWCENTDLVTVGSSRVGKAGTGGTRGPRGPQGVVNMTLVEQSIDRKIKQAFHMFAPRSCDGTKLESASARNDSGGVFDLYLPTVGFRGVFCDVTDEGGNWTIFQRRMNGDVDFYRGWDDYVNGFGDLRGDHWLGLEALHQMTKNRNMEMKIKMITKDGVYWVAKYSFFRIGPGSDNYRLHVSGFSGNGTWVRGGLSDHNNHQFSTKDADHDEWPSLHCASLYEAGWWYNKGYGDCGDSNLNGNFNKTGSEGIWWKAYYRLLRFSEMKIRKRA